MPQYKLLKLQTAPGLVYPYFGACKQKHLVSPWYADYKQLSIYLLLLLGNKIDLASDREVPQEEGETFAESHSMRFLQTSAKESDNVDKLFMDIAVELTNNVRNSEIKGSGLEEPIRDHSSVSSCCRVQRYLQLICSYCRLNELVFAGISLKIRLLCYGNAIIFWTLQLEFALFSGFLITFIYNSVMFDTPICKWNTRQGLIVVVVFRYKNVTSVWQEFLNLHIVVSRVSPDSYDQFAILMPFGLTWLP